MLYNKKKISWNYLFIFMVYLWQQQPDKYFVINLNLKSSSITNDAKLAKAFEQRVLEYLTLTKLPLRDFQQLTYQHGLYTPPKGDGLIKTLFKHVCDIFDISSFIIYTLQVTESHASFIQYILNHLLQDDKSNSNSNSSDLTLVCLMDLLNIAASQSTVKPIVVFREIQLLYKWSTASYQAFVSSFEVLI